VSRLEWLICAAPLLALPGCSSSSGAASGAPQDASTGDAHGDAATADTGIDSSSADTSAGDDSASSDAGADVPFVPCAANAGCGAGSFCCVGAGLTQAFCDPNCGCFTALGCSNAGQCLAATDVCCLQATALGCSTGTQQSVCAPFCSGAGQTQLCNPANPNECLQGQCSTDAKSLIGLNIPADAGYGLCK
jgi:hypothetical protein